MLADKTLKAMTIEALISTPDNGDCFRTIISNLAFKPDADEDGTGIFTGSITINDVQFSVSTMLDSDDIAECKTKFITTYKLEASAWTLDALQMASSVTPDDTDLSQARIDHKNLLSALEKVSTITDPIEVDIKAQVKAYEDALRSEYAQAFAVKQALQDAIAAHRQSILDNLIVLADATGNKTHAEAFTLTERSKYRIIDGQADELLKWCKKNFTGAVVPETVDVKAIEKAMKGALITPPDGTIDVTVTPSLTVKASKL